MAIVSATITVIFTSNFTGDHRICYRQVDAVAYDCSNLVTCLGGGASCSLNITVSVDDEACPVTFEGYVQAVCEDISSVTGRVAFTTSYSPVDACESVAYICDQTECAQVSVAVADCGGTNPLTLPKSNLGQVTSFCVPTGTVMPPAIAFSSTPSTVLCCECVEITFTNPAITAKVYGYQSCETRAQVIASLPALSSITVCAINGTEAVPYDNGVTIAIGGVCYPTPL
jgi:hypothetical protein